MGCSGTIYPKARICLGAASSSQERLDEIADEIADEINNRPRKTLIAYSPLEVYRNLLLNHHSAPDIVE